MRVANGVEEVRHMLDIGHLNVVWQSAVQGSLKAFEATRERPTHPGITLRDKVGSLGTMGRAHERRHLSTSVHSGVGPAGAHDDDRLANDGANGLLHNVLHCSKGDA